MKVAFITDNDAYSGIGRQNYSLFNGLKKIDIDLINLYVPARFKGEPSVNCIKSNILNTYYFSLLYGVKCVFPRELKKILKSGEYTHVILGHQFLAYLYPALSRLNIKRIIIIHDLCLFYKENKGLGDIIYEKFLMKNLDKFENIVFISDFTKNDYIKHYNNLDDKKYSTIYQGIDKQEVNEGIKEILIKKYNLKNKRIFVNVGSEDSRKNIITYLKIAEYYKSNKDIVFIRVGKKSPESEKYINEHKINNILYLKGLSDEELIALYSLSDAVISTSLYEGYGRQIFEGYLYSKNVITSDVSDVKKIFAGDNSVFIVDNPGNTEKYCKAVGKILIQCNNTKKMKEISDTALESNNYCMFLKNAI